MKEQTLEEAMEALNQILTGLDAENISLEESFRLYQDGIGLVKYCNEKIDKVEKDIQILNSNDL